MSSYTSKCFKRSLKLLQVLMLNGTHCIFSVKLLLYQVVWWEGRGLELKYFHFPQIHCINPKYYINSKLCHFYKFNFWIWYTTLQISFQINLKFLKNKIQNWVDFKIKNLRRWTIHIRHLFDVPVSRNCYKTVSNFYENSYIYNFV